MESETAVLGTWCLAQHPIFIVAVCVCVYWHYFEFFLKNKLN